MCEREKALSFMGEVSIATADGIKLRFMGASHDDDGDHDRFERNGSRNVQR